MPKLVWRDGAREIWELESGVFQVITPLGIFICSSLDTAHYQLDGNLIIITKNGNKTGGKQK
jgi:hypothetical protein